MNALKDKTNVEIVWLVCMPEKLSMIPNFPLDTKIIDIHNYQNAVQILQSEKPDVIFGSSSYNLISYSLSIAGKFLGIPVISDFSKGLSSIDQTFTSPVGMFFEKSVSTDEHQTQKKFMRRGKFFLYKFSFVMKTQNSIKMNFFEKIKFRLILLRHHLSLEILPIDSRFANNLHWLSSESLVLPLIEAGFDKNTIIVTGDPLFDKQFKQMHNLQSKNEQKVNVLFAPSTFFEHGLCTKFEQDNAIKSIIKTILKNKSLNLTLKIHPSSANFSDYRKLIDSIDPSIEIHQSGDIIDFIKHSDLLILFPLTTVCVFAIAAKKPVIIFNFLNIKGDVFIENNVAEQCINSSQLPSLINSVTNNPLSEGKINKFLTTDTTPFKPGLRNCEVISVSKRFADTIYRIYNKESIESINNII